MKRKQIIEGILVWAVVLGCLLVAVIKPFKSGNGWFYFAAAMIAVFYGVYNPVRKK